MTELPDFLELRDDGAIYLAGTNTSLMDAFIVWKNAYRPLFVQSFTDIDSETADQLYDYFMRNANEFYERWRKAKIEFTREWEERE